MNRISSQIVVCVVLLAWAIAGRAEEPNDGKAAVLESGKYDLRLLVPKMAKDKQDVTFPAEVAIGGDSLLIKTKGMTGNPITLTGTQEKGAIKIGLTADENGKKLTFEYAGQVTSSTSAEGKFRLLVDGKELFDGTWSLASVDDAADGSVTFNVKGDGVEKYEANQTLIGFSNTRIFYTVASQNAIVVVHIDDKDKQFAASGKVHVFAKGVTADDLGKWVNNQHSDALFADIPEPVATHTLPADAIKTVSSKLLGQEKGGPEGAAYDKYSVEFAVGETALTKTLKLGAFKDSATAYTKASAAKKTAALQTLKGKKLLVGSPTSDGVTWQGVENVGAFKKGATQVALNYPMANFDKKVGDFLAIIDLETPLTQKQVDAYTAFAKQHPARTAPVLIIEFPAKGPADKKTVKGRLIGVGNFPTGRAQNFADADLREQPFVPFGRENDE